MRRHCGVTAVERRARGGERVERSRNGERRRGRDDPQFGVIRPIAPVARLERLRDGEIFRIGKIE